jgi:hypothetical protein
VPGPVFALRAIAIVHRGVISKTLRVELDSHRQTLVEDFPVMKLGIYIVTCLACLAKINILEVFQTMRHIHFIAM